MDGIHGYRDSGHHSVLGTSDRETARSKSCQRGFLQPERIRQHSPTADVCRRHTNVGAGFSRAYINPYNGLNKVNNYNLIASLILPPERPRFYQPLTHWNGLYQLNLFDAFILIPYLTILSILAVYGIHRYYLVYLYLKNKDKVAQPKARLNVKPRVTVQLPIYNEMYVVERLVEGVCGIRYPRELLEIQVLDDSTDGTVEIAAACVAKHRALGFDISHVHRANRSGFKAGALENGLKLAAGELIAIFDADFTPGASFLEDVVDYFSDAEVGMVQTRWGHINREYSLLTQVESVILDGHFVIEHGGRHLSGRFFNFNGTAGIWRRQTIESAGGWEHDTLTEDTDLSYRAQLAGWKFLYLPHVVCPAELPVEMNSFKTQQSRWAKRSALENQGRGFLSPDGKHFVSADDRAFVPPPAGHDREVQPGLVPDALHRPAAVARLDSIRFHVLSHLAEGALSGLENSAEVSSVPHVCGTRPFGQQLEGGYGSAARH